MKRFSQGLLGLWLALLPCARAWNHVSVDALPRAFQDNDLTLVAFIAPDSEKCKSLEPAWEDAASAEAPGALLSVQCGVDSPGCDEYATKEYPTIRLFQKDKPSTVYQGPRRASSIRNFLARHRRPVVSQVKAEDLEAFRELDGDAVVIAYLSGPDDEAAGVFAEVAARHRHEFTFGTVTDPAVLEAEGVSPPHIACHRPGDGEAKAASWSGDADGLERAVLEASRPFVSDFTPLTEQRLLDRGWPMVYLLSPTEDGRAALRAALLRFARSYHDSLTAVLVDPADYPDLPRKLGLDPARHGWPAGAVHQLSRDRVYPYPPGRALDSQSVQRWGLDVYQGRVKPWTPPGVTTSYDDLGPQRVATRRLSVASGWPGVKVKVAGHDEL
ncbi:uncharacterized protein E0L32_005513 [Thyridium curvatum]|uniref:Protein disulfide-isomerase n=1 Tax=Thyridium curvatum TaxID=1093900 RepID=A0A507B3J2_9PEZI|nr:uncharacterized protein E0L32_005513 [Thyridium curvatum]TPX14317.1 hypothetical protein E0L32_005513 [Thyridium curvatum]